MRHPIIRHPRKDFSGIVRTIEQAQASGLKRITLRFQQCIVKPSKYQGKVYVFSHEKALNDWGTLSNVYQGWVTADATNLSDAALVASLQQIAQDPTAHATLYGQQTGNCSCCGRELTRKDSIDRGIGPICAEKFGL